MNNNIGNQFYIRNPKNSYYGKTGTIKYMTQKYIIATLDQGIHVWVPISDVGEMKVDPHLKTAVGTKPLG